MFDSVDAWIAWTVAQAASYPQELEAVSTTHGTQLTVILDDGTPICAAVDGEWEGEALRDLAGLLFNRLVVEIAMRRMRRLRNDVQKGAG